MNNKKRIAVLPGDGIGPDVIAEGIKVLKAVAANNHLKLEFTEHPVGGASLDAFGEPVTELTLADCWKSDAIFLGAVGGAKWDSLPLEKRPERALMTIRKTFGCFANLRPIWLPPCLADRTPLKPELVSGGIDIMIIREFIFGLYYGERGRRKLANGEIEAFDTSVYTEKAVHQVAKLAFDIAARRRKKLTSMDKSNILETSRMWREIVTRMGKDYPQVELRHQLIDSGAMLLMAKPAQFDVIVVNNEFGDIISDEASVLAGSLGMIPSAALGDHPPYFFEPIHGSAPDIAGQGIANPIATILTAAMILEYSFDLPEAAAGVRRAVEKVLNDGYRTRDITAPGQKYISTTEMGDRIASIIS